MFLHKILDGPADKSYGIHVAQLAGLPDSLILQSREVLTQLEQQAPTRTSADAIPLFDERIFDATTTLNNSENTAVIDELKQLDLNQMTPIEALTTLMQLQNKIQ
mgnify:CR=1 FL=1